MLIIQVLRKIVVFPGQRKSAGFSFSLWSPRGSSRGPKWVPQAACGLFARILRCFLHIRLKNTSVFVTWLQNPRILQCFLQGPAVYLSYFTVFSAYTPQKHECFCYFETPRLKNRCIFTQGPAVYLSYLWCFLHGALKNMRVCVTLRTEASKSSYSTVLSA